MSAAGVEPGLGTHAPDGAKSWHQAGTLARLLHALNQPLTGLQCSLELAGAAPKSPEEYARTIAEAVVLTSRMRKLVEAMRQVLEIEAASISGAQNFRLEDLLRELVGELAPVFEMREVRTALACKSVGLLRCDRQFVAETAFRLIESVLSITRRGTQIGIALEESGRDLRLEIEWNQGTCDRECETSAELGLLLAETRCERIGGRWHRERRGEKNVCAILLPVSGGRGHSDAPEESQ